MKSTSTKKGTSDAYKLFAVQEQEKIREQKIAYWGDLKPEFCIRPDYEIQLAARHSDAQASGLRKPLTWNMLPWEKPDFASSEAPTLSSLASNRVIKAEAASRPPARNFPPTQTMTGRRLFIIDPRILLVPFLRRRSYSCMARTGSGSGSGGAPAPMSRTSSFRSGTLASDAAKL
ncbi:hypothetical protein DFS34DRAFT_598196 [Phlyctochytrium arcticum]|nr:hypothetical protein DFS34DRAFT_598196 [Phlyctochytrium arcticum]